RSLLATLRGASGRIDEASLRRLAAGAGIAAEEAATSLANAGVTLVTRRREEAGRGELSIGPLPIRETWGVPEALDEAWIEALLGASSARGAADTGAVPRASIALVAGPNTTGIQLLRAVALARIAGFG